MFTPFDGFTVFPAALAFGMSAWNAWAWPDDRARSRLNGRVSVLIPARNEARRILAAVRAALAAAGPDDEVIVCDDQSTDGTAAMIARIRDPRLRVLDGAPLPPGWVGKAHACHQLAAAATGSWLVFLDADVTADPSLLERLGGVFQQHNADVVTGFPQQLHGTFAEQLVLPMLPLSFMAWIPLDAIWRRPEPWLLVVSGQVLAFRRETLEEIGGFRAIRSALVDDMAICGAAKRSGARVVFATLHRGASCRMYDGPDAIWEGFTKNLYPGLGQRPLALVATVTLYASAFLLPWLRMAIDPGWQAIVGVVAGHLALAIVAARTRLRWWTAFTATPGAVAFILLALGSWRRARAGTLTWRGRRLGQEEPE